MAHWSDYSLRGWLSFLAFMHIGLCLRSFLDPNFLFGKIFHENIQKDIILVHYFSIHSLIQAFILIQSAIHLYVIPIQTVNIIMLISFVAICLLEAFYFQTMDFYGGTLLPFAMSVISLIWLIMFHFVWKPWLSMEVNEDSSMRCGGFISAAAVAISNHHKRHHHHHNHKSSSSSSSSHRNRIRSNKCGNFFNNNNNNDEDFDFIDRHYHHPNDNDNNEDNNEQNNDGCNFLFKYSTKKLHSE